jgi:hypothetical protein
MTIAKSIAQNSQAYWRQSNLSYLQYLNISSTLLRNVVKVLFGARGRRSNTQRERERKTKSQKFFSHNFSQEPAKSKALGRGTFFFNKATYGGEKGSKQTIFTSLYSFFCLCLSPSLPLSLSVSISVSLCLCLCICLSLFVSVSMSLLTCPLC